MSWKRIHHFLQKTPGQRADTVRYFARRGLSKFPYVPVPVRLQVSPSEKTVFWWSYVVPFFRPERDMLEYWGEDVGELRFLWHFLRPGMTFLDAGAYHGVYSILAAQKTGRRGRVVAFEPSPRERRRLELHLRMNRMRWVSVEPRALGAAGGRRKLFMATADATMNSLRRPVAESTVQEIEVETVCLDEYCAAQHIERLDLIKLDTEGGEIEVVEGARHMLKSTRPLLICEVLDLVTQPWGYPARQIIARLKEEGYEWFDFRPEGSIERHREQETYPEIRNYLAVPREKQNEVESWLRR